MIYHKEIQKHLLYVPFSGLGLYNGYRGDEWLEHRIKIFQQFVMPSLVAQTNRQFILWISWRPEDEGNLIIEKFRLWLDEIKGMKYVFTFGGLCFYDDKFPDAQARIKLLANLVVTLPDLRPLVANAQWVYLTIQPSDDMYLCDAVEKIQAVAPAKKKAVGWRAGYIMNYLTKEVAEYNPDTLPPFTTIIFPTATFLNPLRHFKYIGPYRSHEFVKNHLNFEELEGRGFVVGTHGENISTTWNVPYKGRLLDEEEKKAVLIKTDQWFSEPLKMSKTSHIIWRERLNKLPKPMQKYIKPFFYYVVEKQWQKKGTL